MRDEERLARALQSGLASTPDVEVRLEGAGVHWLVEVVGPARRCKIHCFWYGDAAALMLGMNPRNARTSSGPRYPVRTGAEYALTLFAGDGEIAEGRTPDEAAAIGAARAWVADASLDEVNRAWPFVDGEARRMRGLLELLTASCGDVARCVIDSNLSAELWAYGDGRSCRLYTNDRDHVVGCSFWLGPAQVGFGDVTRDPVTSVSRWLHGATLAELAPLGVAIEPHAELLERGEYARWHWLHTRERIADPDDVLAGSRPLLERLADSAIATRFFSFSSLNRFCFTASSHFPWVDDELPVINPPYGTHGYIIDVGSSRTECTLEQAVVLVERTLAAYPVKPFFGSAANLAIAPLDAELAAQGSPLRAALVQRCQWFDAQVAAGVRSCAVGDDLRSVEFRDASIDQLRARFATAAHAVTAIRRWLEDNWTLDELRLDPNVLP